MTIVDAFGVDFIFGVSLEFIFQVLYLVLVTSFAVPPRGRVSFLTLLRTFGVVGGLAYTKVIENIFSYFRHMIIGGDIISVFSGFGLDFRSTGVDFTYFIGVRILFEVDGVGEVAERVFEVIFIFFLLFFLHLVLFHVVEGHNFVKVEGNLALTKVDGYLF